MRSHLRLGRLTDSKHFFTNKKEGHYFFVCKSKAMLESCFFLLISIVDVFFLNGTSIYN